MKARAIARIAILSATLALGISCKTPLVEGPTSVTTKQHRVPKPHPCARKAIIGGLPSSSHILLQKHESPVTMRTTNKTVRSQILQYHVLSDLIKNYGIRVVFLEGVGISEDVSKATRARCSEKSIDRTQFLFESCVINTRRALYRPFVLSHSAHDAEDLCLAGILWGSYRLKEYGTALLMFQNPSVLFTGYERDRKSRSQKTIKYRLLMRIGEQVGLAAGLKIAGEFEKLVFLAYVKNVIKPRLKYVDRDAINEILLHSSHNTALVIGNYHQDAMERIIKEIPFHKRPTFYFVMPECQDNPNFFVSPTIVDLAAR